jgi:hypothetical protein
MYFTLAPRPFITLCNLSAMSDASDCFRHVLYEHCTARPLVGMPHTCISGRILTPYTNHACQLIPNLADFTSVGFFWSLFLHVPIFSSLSRGIGVHMGRYHISYLAYYGLDPIALSTLSFKCTAYQPIALYLLTLSSLLPTSLPGYHTYIHPNKLQSHTRQPSLNPPQKRMIRQTLPKARLKIPQINP